MNDKAIMLDKTGQAIAGAIRDVATAIIKGSGGTIYGYRIKGDEPHPASKVTYLEKAVGMNAAHMDYVKNVFDYGSWTGEEFFFPRPCMVRYDGTVDYYLDPNDYTKKADGTPSNIADTSYAGNAMMEWGRDGRIIWEKRVPSADRTSCSIYIADYKADEGFEAWPFINSEGRLVSHFYTPIYNGAEVSGKLRSISGLAPLSGKNAQSEMNLAASCNQGEAKIWNIETFADIQLINDLLVLLGKSTDTQTVFGYGRGSACYHSDGSQDYGKAVSGMMNDKGLFYGNNGNVADEPGKPAGVKVFGMEHWWGNIWRRYVGHLLVQGKHKVKLTYGKEDGSTVVGYNTTGEGYIEHDTHIGASNYIKTMHFDSKAGPLIASTEGGSSSTYYCDYTWINAGATCFAYRGGFVNGSADLGAFCCGLGAGPSYGGWSFGAGLSLKPLA